MTDILSDNELNDLSTDELLNLYFVYNARAIIQKNIEQAIKILINSLYGYLGSPYSRFFNVYIAEAITLTGQALIQTSANAINADLNKITGVDKDRCPGIDTDSNYFDLTDIVNLPKSGWANKPTNEIVDLLDKFCNVRIDKVLDETFKNLLSNLNSFDNCISMKREAIGSGVFVQKKRYTMLVYDNEGVRYTKPKLKITGLEAVRSSTPKYFRDKLKVIYEMMYYNKQDEIQEEIKNIKQEFFNLPLISIAKPAGVNGLSDYDNNSKELGFFAKGTPSGVKASLTYNRAIEQYGLKDKFHTINSGDKVKIFNLKMPNPFKNDKIAVIDKIPAEFNLDKYVDKEGLFNDSFISPLENILKVVSWSPLKMINLDDFF